ncbi:NCA2 family protein [Aspergillus mulundensis]|uniref:Nuclear control of ATPase protein 2 n=1 Tax=Aspergillus mulundensis TaxID=1810919 RepID=A0A3D8QZA6_9EURO|nr:Uncharacterized protein DSM5745_08951 [Aspergillus mulundensis]RDW67085.1 Uncharacterized protein DSM5745_08951 [Aspergillus mulundensis]
MSSGDSALKFYRLETQLEELHQRINDTIEANIRGGGINTLNVHLKELETIIGQLSIKSKSVNTRHHGKLLSMITKSRQTLRAASESWPESDVFAHRLSDLSWLISAKASLQILAEVLKIFSDNVFRINEELKYWEGVLQFDWCVCLYALQISPYRMWQRCIASGCDDSKRTALGRDADDRDARIGSSPSTWLRFYTSVQRCVSPTPSSYKLGPFLTLSGPKLEIQARRRKLKAMRDFNASAVGLLCEECLSFETGLHVADGGINDGGLRQRVRTTVDLLGSILQCPSDEFVAFEHFGGNTLASNQGEGGLDLLEPQAILQGLNHIIADTLPLYKHATAGSIVGLGRPPVAVRYWLPLSLAMISATTSLRIARHVGPVLAEAVSNFGATALDFWKNWVLDPIWKLVRTIRHDDKSEIALMSKNSLETDRASLERMVVDFVLDRDEQNYYTSSADIIADKVREGDLTPVLRAYEKDLRSPFIGTFRGDLVRALLIQIQKTKVDVEVAMSGIDALLKSQELVFGFVGLTPGLLITYASIRWVLGLLGNRRGFRMGRRQDDMRYALRNIHRILSSSSPTEEGRLDHKNHGLLICNAGILIGKGQTMLKGEDLRLFQEDVDDLVNENRADKQLRVIQRMAWTYSKWT